MSERTLYQSNPTMFRSNPILFVLAVALIVVYGAGLVVLGIWWLACKGTLLTITDRKTTLRTGILSKNTNEVWHRDVRNIKVSQGPLQRLMGVGNIEISSSGQGDVEITVQGMPNPDEIREIVNQHRVA